MRTLLLAALLLVLPRLASAQTEIEMGQISLKGITSFQVVVEVERSGMLIDQPILGVERVRASVVALLQGVGLPVAAGYAPGETPFLLVHVNAMDADRGQIPFAVEAGFYQTVRLNRPPNLTVDAPTWTSAILGMTYHNQLELIHEAVQGLMGEFIGDFQAVNS